jgi:hypothetical protein
MMGMDEYSMSLYVKQLLEEARATAAQRAMAETNVPRVMPAVRAAIERLRAGYLRWSSAVSAGSKPTTARAWSKSR